MGVDDPAVLDAELLEPGAHFSSSTRSAAPKATWSSPGRRSSNTRRGRGTRGGRTAGRRGRRRRGGTGRCPRRGPAGRRTAARTRGPNLEVADGDRDVGDGRGHGHCCLLACRGRSAGRSTGPRDPETKSAFRRGTGGQPAEAVRQRPAPGRAATGPRRGPRAGGACHTVEVGRAHDQQAHRRARGDRRRADVAGEQRVLGDDVAGDRPPRLADRRPPPRPCRRRRRTPAACGFPHAPAPCRR